MPCDRFDTTDADIILRSADGQEFPAHKSMLSFASSVFRNMFSFPQPPSPEPPPTPLVDVCETGQVLDGFLRCIYPVSKPTVEDFDLLEALVAAADKYEAEIILNTVESWLVAPVNLRKDPLRVYVIACSTPALWEAARAAAGRMTFSTVTSGNPGMVARLPMSNYHHLTTYLLRREKEARRTIDDPSWTMFCDPRCACGTEDRLGMKVAIKKAIMDAFVSDPSLSEEGSVAVACRQLSKIRACHLGENCLLVTQGGEYAKELTRRLVEMSNELWCCA